MKSFINFTRLLRKLIDCIILEAAFLLAYKYITLETGFVFTSIDFRLLALSMIIWIAIGSFLHLYDDYRSRPFSYEFIAILKAAMLNSCILTFVFFYFFKYFPYSRTFLIVYTINIFIGVTISKFIIKKFMLRFWTKGVNTKNILIVGAGETGLNFHQTIAKNDHFGYRCIGFVDDKANPSLNGQYLGRVSELRNILESHEVDEVVLAMPESTRELTEDVIVASEKAAKRVRIIADCYRHCSSTVSMSLFGAFPLITIRSSPLDDAGYQVLKRAFDVIFTLCLLVAFSWLFLLIAILIKLSSKGPVIYCQERWGLKNKKMICYKFRTMRLNNEDGSKGKYVPTSRNDPRVTRIGRFLRRTNLDELPQFINVLKGEMSFVGPRPHPTPMHLELKETIQHYMLRHMVKPGITGWAQVNGCRGENHVPGQMQKRIDFDIWYTENYSPWLDFQIIFQTVVNMIKGDKNAY
ncbi:undecaprenyl-phosphate glucose phosphotransferase [Chitinophaga vietnamensis]|uniref:undecaprenyl-phosphate glucose phosphotransferase n=1 Tax=Chitinophaga vietnamensis TaxID=2593957 RepID=UPI001177CE18|nr:undecaprenyl-phosphate glucose phosphotransferase [Chitinophaga vietnamensis]